MTTFHNLIRPPTHSQLKKGRKVFTGLKHFFFNHSVESAP